MSEQKGDLIKGRLMLNTSSREGGMTQETRLSEGVIASFKKATGFNSNTSLGSLERMKPSI